MIRRTLIIASLLIPLIWTIPIWSGYRTPEPDQGADRFLGWMRSDDFHRYGSFVDQTRVSNALIYTDFSSVEPQSPRMIAIYFWILGIIGKCMPVSAATLWLLSRFIVSWLFVLLLLRFLDRWTTNNTQKNLAFLFILFSAGFEQFASSTGIFYPRVKNSWMDGFSTFCSFHNPLKIAGISVVLLLFLVLDRYLRTEKRRYLIGAGFLILLAWMVHPNSAIPGYTGVLALALIRPNTFSAWRQLFSRWLKLIPLILPVILILIYIAWMKSDPTTAGIIQQYSLKFLTEPYRYYPLRYGLILPLALLGVIWSYSRRDNLTIMMIGWLLGAEFFAHFARMSGLLFQHMVHLPLALFAAAALCRLCGHSRKWLARITICIIICFGVQNVSTVHQVVHQTRGDVWPTSLYWSKSEIRAAQMLRQEPEGNVLSTRDTGNKIAWIAQKHVLLGHWGTTPDKGTKEKKVRAFFNSATSLNQKMDTLTEYSIRYIWFGSRERQLGGIDPNLPLSVLIDLEEVTVYEVNKINAISGDRE